MLKPVPQLSTLPDVAGNGGKVPASAMPTFGASGPSHAQGAVPDPGAAAGASRFLREDATWQTALSGASPNTFTATQTITPATAGLDGFSIGSPVSSTNSGRSPAVIPNLLALYLSDVGVYSDAGVTPATNGGKVQQWNDQSGNGFHLTQTTSASQPTFVTNQANGKPVVRFDYTSSVMNSSWLASNSIWPSDSDITIALVWRPGTAGNSAERQICGFYNGNDFVILGIRANNDPYFNTFNSAEHKAEVLTTVNNASGFHILIGGRIGGQGSGATNYAWLDGATPPTTFNPAGYSQLSSVPFQVGRMFFGADADICAVAVFKGGPWTNDRVALEAWAAATYGVTTASSSVTTGFGIVSRNPTTHQFLSGIDLAGHVQIGGPDPGLTGGSTSPAGFTTTAAMSVYGTFYANAGQGEHLYTNNWNGFNTVAYWNQNPNGYSASRFLDQDGYERGAFGTGNKGVNSSTYPWTSATYFEASAFNPANPNPHLVVATTGQVAGGGPNGTVVRVECDVNGNLILWDCSAVYPNNKPALTVTPKGNIVFGSGALATSATDGFLALQTCAGAPTGAPTAYTGRAQVVYDTTNNKLWVWNGSAWKGVALS
jgi:hypothetical protein